MESQIILFEKNYDDVNMTQSVIFYTILTFLFARFIKYRV